MNGLILAPRPGRLARISWSHGPRTDWFAWPVWFFAPANDREGV